jgi:hypothetical protein
MFSILHITDLHRAKNDPISNPELLSALINDRDYYLQEDPPIRSPDGIVVSGDMIQGAALGASGAGAEIASQYEVASDFLANLTDRFLGGDRSRVIIVPGNHDIDWNIARASMSPVTGKSIPRDVLGALNDPGSLYRWDWKSRQLFKIVDPSLYDQRLSAFWDFFERFYQGVDGLLKVTRGGDANLFSLDEGRIAVAAFNSCAGNDCFSFRGEIHREAIAQAHMDLKDEGPWWLRIAVWHHDIDGPPQRTDYMDVDIVRSMIGRGFGMGLYGHQHRTQITPEHIYRPERETMAVTSAGSLCAGRRELPTGARRGYSIIEINDDYRSARVHVREMQVANLFSRASLPTFGGRSFVDLEWTVPLDAGGRPENAGRDKLAAALGRAEIALYEKNDAPEALELLQNAGAGNDPYGRKLMVEAALEIGPSKLIEVVAEPGSIEELVAVVDAHILVFAADEAEAAIRVHAERLELPTSVRRDLEERIRLMRRVRS